jgi:diguanylate cyclase (GGDEF)-like protein
LAIFATTLCHASAVSKHYSIQDLKTLPVNSPVSLTGVVSYVDEAASLFWIHDPTGAMPVAMNPLPSGIHTGDEVFLKAITTALYDDLKGPASVGLERIRIHLAAHTGPVTPSATSTLAVQPYNSGLKPTVWQLKEGNPRPLLEPAAARTPQQNPAGAQLQRPSPTDLAVIHSFPAWTPSALVLLALILAVLAVAILAILGRVNKLRRRVIEQAEALRKASETTQAISDLSRSMLQVAAQRPFDPQVPVRGTEEISELVDGFNAMLTELQRRDRAKRDAEARLQHMALIDDLTGLPNRRLLTDRLSHSVAKCRRENRKVALLYIDIDGFKLINDSLGHGVGDVLLGQVAQRMKSRFRQSDTLARIGSDEFTLILDDVQSRGDAESAAESALEVLKDPFEIEGHSIRVTASIGISIFPDHGKEGGQLLRQADCAMVAAKRNGKNRIVQFGDGLGSAARERLMLEGELRRAIDEGEIRVHYQPEFDLATNTIVRFEALARWAHPTLGPIPPLSFIPVAEESGLIVPLGAYVLEKACADAVIWQRKANRPIQVAVNVSSVQFARDSFLEEVEDVLRRTGLRPTLLQLELTESATLTGVERAADLIRRLTGRGIGVAMDDFGTGYSCLSYLPRLFLDALKLDRSFVTELAMRQETRAFVQSILSMAHNLHMRVIVEGIETREQLELMRSLGTNEAQGYFLGRPTPNPMELLAWSPGGAAATHEREAVAVS